MFPTDGRSNQSKNAAGQDWRLLVEELLKTSDTARARELVMRLEEVVFNRQQELAVHAAEMDRSKIEEEQQELRRALNLMLEVKLKKLGFPNIR